MEPHWELLEALQGGTFSVRRKHRKYLPQEPREQDISYDVRLQRSVCSPFTIRIERMLAGMLTRKPVRLDDVTDQIREQLFDVDLQGNDLQSWLFSTSRICLRYGHVGVLVDAPKLAKTEGHIGLRFLLATSLAGVQNLKTVNKS